jgi:predicted ArsR family transcriptional regulator
MVPAMAPSQTRGRQAGSEPGQGARDKVLFQLKTRGPQTAEQIAGRLGVTTMAIRQHLYGLAGDGLVSSREERRKVGRPVKIWSLTPKAASRFPDTHGDLTVDILKAVRSTFGEQGLERLIAERSRQQQAAYASRMPAPSAPLEERVAALVTLRSEEGYMAAWSQSEDGSFELSENHCPICAAATVCQGFCRDELETFRCLLGPDVEVSRGDHILAGARRCAYRIEPSATKASPAASRGSRSPAASKTTSGGPA